MSRSDILPIFIPNSFKRTYIIDCKQYFLGELLAKTCTCNKNLPLITISSVLMDSSIINKRQCD